MRTFAGMRSSLAICSVLLVVLLGGCGSSSETGSPSELVPKGVAFYGEVVLDPEGDQESAVREIVGRFPGGDKADERLKSELSKALEKEGFDYAEDIEPVVGDRVAFFASSVSQNDADAAAVIAVDDEDKAREVLDKALRKDGKPREKSYEGTDYLLLPEEKLAAGVLDGNAVIGTEGGLKDAVDTAGAEETVQDDERVSQAIEPLPDEPLAFFYVDGRQLVSALGPAAALGSSFLKVLDDPFAVGLVAEPDAVVVESTVPPSLASLAAPLFFGSGTDAVTDLPADAWYAAGQPKLGETIQGFVRQFAGLAGGEQQIEAQVRAATGLDLSDDILGWMGDFSAFASGTSLPELGAGLVIESSEPATSRRTLRKLGVLLRREVSGGSRVTSLSLPGGGEGFTITDAELPQPIHVVQREDRVVAALGDESASALLEPSETLGDDDDFSAAAGRLGEGFEPANYLDVAPILELAESQGASDDEEYVKAKPYLEVFSRLIAGTKRDGDSVLSRTRVEFR